jgi:hypothetical protein
MRSHFVVQFLVVVLALGCGSGDRADPQAQQLSAVLTQLLPGGGEVPGFTEAGTEVIGANQAVVQSALPPGVIAIRTRTFERENQYVVVSVAVMRNGEESLAAANGGLPGSMYRDLLGDQNTEIVRGERRDASTFGSGGWAQAVTLTSSHGQANAELLAFARGPAVGVVFTLAYGESKPLSSLDLAGLLDERINRSLIGFSP